MERHYRVMIEEELRAENFKKALSDSLDRISSEETVASVECLSTGEVRRFEIRTGERLDRWEVGDE